MNTLWTKSVVSLNKVKTIKADKTHGLPEADQLLAELGNESAGIPFYVIYPADGGPPITMDGVLTPWRVVKAINQAGKSLDTDRVAQII